MNGAALRLVGAVFAAIGLLTVGLLAFVPGRPAVLSRLEDTGPPRRSMGSFLAGATPAAMLSRLEELRRSFEPKARVRGSEATKLTLAGLKVTPAEWTVVVGGSSMIIGLLGLVRFQSLVALPIGMVLGYLTPEVALTILRGRRRRALDKQLAPLLQSLNAGLRAGMPFAAALDHVGTAAQPPINAELQRASREIHLGTPIHVAFDKLVLHNQLDELRLMVTALQIHSQVGGNLVEILESIELTIRERVRIKGEIRTLTAQARASGWVLGLLPLILGALLFVIAPTYFNPMVSDPIGLVMLGVAGFSLVLGCVFIQKLAKVEY